MFRFEARVTSEMSPSLCFLEFIAVSASIMCKCCITCCRMFFVSNIGHVLLHESFSALVFHISLVVSASASSSRPHELQPARACSLSASRCRARFLSSWGFSRLSAHVRDYPRCCCVRLERPSCRSRPYVLSSRALAVSAGWRNNEAQGRDGGSENNLLVISGAYFGLDLEPCWGESCTLCYTNPIFFIMKTWCM